MRLNGVVVGRERDTVVVFSNADQRFELADPRGDVELLLMLLSDWGMTQERLIARLVRPGRVSEQDLLDALDALHDLGLLLRAEQSRTRRVA